MVVALTMRHQVDVVEVVNGKDIGRISVIGVSEAGDVHG